MFDTMLLQGLKVRFKTGEARERRLCIIWSEVASAIDQPTTRHHNPQGK
jgi:hypothetical protein